MSEQVQLSFDFVKGETWLLTMGDNKYSLALTDICKFVSLPKAESYNLSLLGDNTANINEEMYQILRSFLMDHIEAKYGEATGCIVRVDGKHLGCYEGDHIHPIGLKNPRIRLEDGTVIWGLECWWEYMAYRSDMTATEYIRKKENEREV